jgi:DNA polymerase III delta subunit
VAKREPNVLIVTGDQAFSRRRFVQEVVAAKAAEGWRIDRVDGADESQLGAALSSGMFMQTQPETLVVVDHPAKADPEIYKEHAQDRGTKTVLLLHHEGIPSKTTKFGKYVATQKSSVKEWKAPKPWEAQNLGAAFCIRELKKHGITIDPAVAKALVERVGSDLGILSFEVLKLVMLAGAENVTAITPGLLPHSLAVLLEAEMQPVVAAVADRNPKRLCVVLNRVRQTHKSDATIPVCRVLGGTALKWIGVADLKEKKTPDQAALLLGHNAYHYRNNLLPQVNRWPRRDLIKLLRVLAVSERAVLSGVISPWAGLVGRLISVCQGS